MRQSPGSLRQLDLEEGAQPWSVAGGLFLSAIAGVLCGHLIPWPPLAAAAAVALAIFAMAALRCLHPPGGALALGSALLAQQMPTTTLLATVALNILAVLLAVMAVNNIVPGRRYPQCAPPLPKTRPQAAHRGIAHEDLQSALNEIDAYLDISEDDLVDVYNRANEHAFRRHVGLRCRDIMSADPVTTEFATELNAAWGKLRAYEIQSLPVIDRSRRVIGLIGIDDFVGHVEPDPGESLGENLRRLLRPTPGMHATKPEVVGQVMRVVGEDIIDAGADDDIAATAASLGRRHQHTVPVVDADGRLVGMLTQGDVIGGLFRQLALTGARGGARGAAEGEI